MAEITQLHSVESAEPPSNIEAEQQLLGALLNNNGLYDKVASLTAGHFYEPLHGRIFEAIEDLVQAGDLASPVTLKARLEGDEGMADLGGPAYLARLSGAAMSSFAVRDYAALLSDLKARRDILAALETAEGALRDGQQATGDIALTLDGVLAGILAQRDAHRPTTILQAVTDALTDVRAAMDSGAMRGVSHGLPGLDRLIPIFGPGELILLGGRPSMGKTGVALSAALNAARAGHAVIIVSLEMLPKALALRAMSEASSQMKTAIPYTDMAAGRIAEFQRETLIGAARSVGELPISFLSRDYATIGAMLAGVREALKALPKAKVPLVVVDYAQLLQSPARSRYEQITDISIALKGMAMRLECPVLALSQLSRAVEQRDDKRPQLSDLRESGQLEQDADAVLFCYRDEYYIEREKPDDSDMDKIADWQQAMERAHNRLEIIVAKQRQGPVGVAKMRFNPALNIIWEG